MTQEPPGGDADETEGTPAVSPQEAQETPADREPENQPEPGSDATSADLTQPEPGAEPTSADLTQPEPGPDATSADLAEAQPGTGSVFDRYRALFVVVGAVAVLVVAIVVVVLALGQPPSTGDVRVITPAPGSAGGLSRDYADEAGLHNLAGSRQFRTHYAPVLSQPISSYATAIYTNAPAGGPATAASVAVVYLGYNMTAPVSPADAVSGIFTRITPKTQATIAVSGLPGDTIAKCVGSMSNGRPVAACVWATDRTVSIMFTLTPTSVADLANLLKKVQPDVERG